MLKLKAINRAGHYISAFFPFVSYFSYCVLFTYFSFFCCIFGLLGCFALFSTIHISFVLFHFCLLILVIFLSYLHGVFSLLLWIVSSRSKIPNHVLSINTATSSFIIHSSCSIFGLPLLLGPGFSIVYFKVQLLIIVSPISFG